MNYPTLMTIFAHPDDETFSAGATLAKYAKHTNVYAVSIIKDPKREEEFNHACKILGATPIQLEFKKISSCNFYKIKRKIEDLIREFKPKQIITHVDFDYHHEHKKVRNIVEEAIEWVSHTTSDKEAFQVSSLWGAETTVLIPVPDIHIDTTDTHDDKLEAIKVYETQSHKGGENFYSKFHHSKSILRGVQSSTNHAEAFQVIPIKLTGSFKPIKVMDQFPY